MSRTGLIKSFFLRDEVDNTSTVREANYLKMLQQFSVPQLRARNDVSNIFQQDWSPSHFDRCAKNFSNTNFPD